MVFEERRAGPRLWAYVLFWLCIMLQTLLFSHLFLALSGQALANQDYYRWLEGLEDMNVTLITVLSALYTGRLIYSKRWVGRPVEAVGSTFLIFLAGYTLFIATAMWSCRFYNDSMQCASWYPTNGLYLLLGSASKAALFAFFVFGIVWLFETSKILKQVSSFFGMYGGYFASAVCALWLLIILYSLGQLFFQ
jgi:hypothetical protein